MDCHTRCPLRPQRPRLWARAQVLGHVGRVGHLSLRKRGNAWRSHDDVPGIPCTPLGAAPQDAAHPAGLIGNMTTVVHSHATLGWQVCAAIALPAAPAAPASSRLSTTAFSPLVDVEAGGGGVNRTKKHKKI